jgi:methyl-accepting chemotaxis protein
MQAVRGWTVRAKLWLLVTLSAAGLAGVTIFGHSTISTVKVYGPLFQQIVVAKDLLADILPPPLYLIELLLVDNRALAERSQPEREAALARVEQLRKDFNDRRDYWTANLPEGPARRILLEKVVPLGAKVLEVHDGQFVPALRQGDLAKAREALDGPLYGAYLLHRTAVDELVTLSNADFATLEEQAKVIDVGPKRLLIFLGVGTGLAVALLGFFVARDLVSKLQRTTAALESAANGDLTSQTAVTSEDEFGQIAAAVERLLAALRGSLGAVSSSAELLGVTAKQLHATSLQLTSSAAQTSSQVGEVAHTSDGVSNSVQTVATASEELGATIKEIASTSSGAARVAQNGVSVVAKADEVIARLAGSTAQIGTVLKAISAIAEQTNLLALNATIEAARAGAAGKGFAVVASEVKELARETAKATEDIAQKVLVIEEDARSAVDAVSGISKMVGEISANQTTIAAAVEEQTAATAEMNRNLTAASTGSTGIVASMRGVSAAATDTARGAQETQQASEQLTAMAATLRDQMKRFRVN